MKVYVYVIMGNDYPHSVHLNKVKADKFVEDMTALEDKESSKPIQQRARSRIYWRSYEFEVKD